ncbi:MAG: right-handed parallel beta-helix repeat-containing protein [Chromatiales bacterium]|jgi:hypothetical protein
MSLRHLFIITLSLLVNSVWANAWADSGRVWRVGPGLQYETPGQLRKLVRDGDTIEILPGTYLNDSVVWHRNRLTFRGVGGRPHLQFDAHGRIGNGKAIWVIGGDDVLVENIEFSGARVPHLNGAGIRVEGRNLTVRNCHFHHNEFAILSGRIDGRLTIENSEFGYQHREGRFAHGVYVGDVNRLVFRGNYVHHSDEGHHLKSRARINEIAYNRMTDERDGNSSYLIDLPNCGRSVIIGNLLHQGAHTANNSAIAYGAEGCKDKPKSLQVLFNTFVNDNPLGGNFVRNWTDTPVLVSNNLLFGTGLLAEGPVQAVSNLNNAEPGLRDVAGFDYQLLPGSPAIDAADPDSQQPLWQYRHPLQLEPRPTVGQTDIGAYEYDTPAD